MTKIKNGQVWALNATGHEYSVICQSTGTNNSCGQEFVTYRRVTDFFTCSVTDFLANFTFKKDTGWESRAAQNFALLYEGDQEALYQESFTA